MPSLNTSDLMVRGAWRLAWWVSRGGFVVRCDGDCVGGVAGGLGPVPVGAAFDAEVGHLAFDDAGVGAVAA